MLLQVSQRVSVHSSLPIVCVAVFLNALMYIITADTLTSLVLPISRIWNDGHKDTSHTKHQQTPQFAQAVQDVRNMCPSYQLKKMFFDVLRGVVLVHLIRLGRLQSAN